MTLLESVFNGEQNKPPFWFMRQAGRYLPEYRALRAELGGFLDMCYSPENAAEVTLQPIRRFDMSAAIIFSDILVIPDALGYHLEFIKGEGPNLTPLETVSDYIETNQQKMVSHLEPVYKALQLTRKKLSPEKTLIGFTGAPWTIACYMLQGKGGKEFAAAREQVYRHPELVEKIISQLVDTISLHLIKQIEAGANVVQIFDSWAAYAPFTHREELIYKPTQAIVNNVKAAYPKTPIIGFPKGLGSVAAEYVAKTGVDGLGVDMFSSLDKISQSVGDKVVLQGNLDPLLLASNKDKTIEQARTILAMMKGKPFIFNLGHGMVPHTPIENVEALIMLLSER
jgi:uroporphyrinogen decarboxylase